MNRNKAYPFKSIQILVRSNVLLCFSPVRNCVVDRHIFLPSHPLQQLPQFLAFTIRLNRLDLEKGRKSKYRLRGSIARSLTCLIMAITTLSRVNR